MKIQVFVLLCFLISIASSASITGIPSVVCGHQNFNVTATGLTSVSYVTVTSSVTTIGVSPSILILTPPNDVTGNINITCNSINPVQISFFNLNTSQSLGTFNVYCKGVMYIQNPISSIIRGNDFSTTLYLFPAPQSVVDITVRVDNPLIVPGSDRLTFGVGQHVEDEVFYVPAGEVGNVNITFASRSLRDYSGPGCSDLVESVDILGTITSDLGGKTIGDGVYTNVTVKIQPPALDNPVVVNIDSSRVGIAQPPQLVFLPGQDTAHYRLLPNFDGIEDPTTITYTSDDYYDTLVDYVYVIGNIFSSIPPEVPTNIVQDIHVAILPGASTSPITVYLTASSNINVPEFITFPPLTSLVHFNLFANTSGPSFVTFSSPGYTSFTDSFTAYDLTCNYGSVANIEKTFCVTCPTVNDYVCSGHGDCLSSTINKYQSRCECYGRYYGTYCELQSPFYYIYGKPGIQFNAAGNQDFNFNFFGELSYITVDIPPSLITDDKNPIYGGNGTLYFKTYQPYDPFPFAVDPTEVTPIVEGFTVSPLIDFGFGIDVVYVDNTAFDFTTPIAMTLYADEIDLTQTQFLESQFYYFNISSKDWVPAISICPPNYFETYDLLNLQFSSYICAPGQYQFFVLVPIPPPAPAEIVYVYNTYGDVQNEYQFPTTGGTGVQQPLPPQPHLAPEVVNDPSPPRNIAQEYENSASQLSYFVPLILLLSLLF